MIETNRGVVHPNLCDIMGHLTTRHYAAIFDDASYHLAHACGLPIDRETGFVDLELTTRFVAELRAGDLFFVRSGISRIGNSSFSAHHELVNCNGNNIAASQEASYAFFDLIARKSRLLPEEFRTRAAALMTASGDQSNS
ncbi:acyl-CoA thioesterase [Emcibacter sp.]|uniref:acyl-CoA thioesterase n=1 Tax=Emcibacter sp. TaxID=1979954 RepID=UPI002AA664B2|nr:thioesterase family protein [Emcibacter sp.]